MAQISQNPDGTYTRSYSDTELTLIKSLQEEIKYRQAGDQELWADLTTVTNRVQALEDGQFSLSELQNIITGNIVRIDDHDTRLLHLEEAVIVDAYSKKQTDQIIPWKVEQIAHTFDIPNNQMFDKANLDDIRVGYRNYHHGDIYEPYDNHVPENTMQRFTIWAFASSPKIATFNINYADRCVVIIDDIVHETYIDVGGNFAGVPKRTVVDLKEGWTRIQFLIANETQAGGLVVTSDLIEKADYLTNLDYFAGMITGDRIQAGSLDERHFSPNMDLVVHTIHATATDVPGVIIGNPNEQGILQIADGTISKAKDEPFVFSDGIRVNGYIRVTQLLIDKDFIRAGDGMIVNTIKDEYGYTKMYEIINDVRIVNGGGMHITGDAQQGYTITNDLQLTVSPGLGIEGDPIRGYYISNEMILESLGGIEVLGNAQDGYTVRNVMKLTSDYGIIKVTGNAWEGYSLKNVLQILAGGGIKLEGSVNEGEVTIVNDMSLLVKNPNGMLEVTGDAATGYFIEGFWPEIEGIGDVDVTHDGWGNYEVSVHIHVKDVTKRNESKNFITVYDSGNGNHQLGIDNDIFYDRVAEIVKAESTVKGVVSDVDFIEIADYGDEIKRLQIPDYNKMIPWIQKGQAPWEFGHTSSTPSLGPGAWFNENNAQFIQTTASGFSMAGFFGGVIPAKTANCLRITTQGGYDGGSATVEVEVEVRIIDPNVSGGIWERVFRRTISSALDATTNYNEMLHTLPIPVRDYWRHFDIRFFVRRVSGTGRANAKFREAWCDHSGNSPAHNEATQRTES